MNPPTICKQRLSPAECMPRFGFVFTLSEYQSQQIIICNYDIHGNVTICNPLSANIPEIKLHTGSGEGALHLGRSNMTFVRFVTVEIEPN